MWLFFFSSRRRHTRWTGDWSSDVCSSDLGRRCASAAATLSADEMINAIEPRDADDDQVDRHHVVQQPRHEEDQDAGDKGDKRRDMRNRDGHRDLLGWQSTIMTG